MKKILMGVAIAAAFTAAIPTFAQELGPAAQESASDMRVQDAVMSRLLADHRLDSALFSVSVHDGHVSVLGTIRDQSQETEIYTVARKVEGVVDVFVFAQEDTQ